MDNTWLRLTIRLPNSLKPFLKNEKNKSEAIVKALESHFGVRAPDDRLSAIESRLTALEQMMGTGDILSSPVMTEEDKTADNMSPLPEATQKDDNMSPPPAKDKTSPTDDDKMSPAKPNRINWGDFLDEFPDKTIADLEELTTIACERYPDRSQNVLRETLRRKLKGDI